ncbi:LysM peptidoglycan-binding domain-containing protein [Streptacidiphilus rugosus]|uniref:LysM peptidoglycan-binding domain-containing protein n=1 Tax=Streptacidiphilus rugosus TaxID=405783 RepID=UPI00068B8563|nr:LysM peptidoglycan-binding domain-containing protein [Streptacidiphilus rugosus]
MIDLSEYENWDSGDKAMLIGLDLTDLAPLVFNYNPLEIGYSRNAQTKTQATSGKPHPVYCKTSPAKITLSDVTLEGLDTKLRCEALIGWTIPASSSILAEVMSLGTELPPLMFIWGPPVEGFVKFVNLTDCSIKFTRFTAIGIPIRAKISMTLTEISILDLPTNPTSGGLPGRGAHLVRQGESLPAITKKAYGHPRNWRALARANEIEDPLRTKPGQYVYLPNTSEFTEEEV